MQFIFLLIEHGYDFKPTPSKSKRHDQEPGDLFIYLVSGLVWGLWHAPYYFVFLSEESMQAVLPVNTIVFTLVAVISMLAWVVMFVELFRITQSVWPVVLIHAVENSRLNLNLNLNLLIYAT